MSPIRSAGFQLSNVFVKHNINLITIISILSKVLLLRIKNCKIKNHMTYMVLVPVWYFLLIILLLF